MSPSWRRALGIVLLILTLMVAALMVAAWTLLPLDHTSITIGGETYSLADLSGTNVVAFFVIAVVVVVFALVAAIGAAVFGLGIGVLGVAFGLVVTIGTLALVASPFALVIWLIWRFVRTRAAPPPLPLRP
jgi:hypothetical protein